MGKPKPAATDNSVEINELKSEISSLKIHQHFHWIIGAIVTMLLAGFLEHMLYTQLPDINSKLAKLQTDMDLLLAGRIKTIGSISDEKFQKSLPELRKLMATPEAIEDAKSDLATLKQIAVKLQKTPESSPEYWPTVLQFIEFGSKAGVPASANVPPTMEGAVKVANSTFEGLDGSYDVLFGGHRAIILDGGRLTNIEVKDSRVQFTENPVIMRNVKFTNCVFEMPEGISAPNGYLRKAAGDLLASAFTTVKDAS